MNWCSNILGAVCVIVLALPALYGAGAESAKELSGKVVWFDKNKEEFVVMTPSTASKPTHIEKMQIIDVTTRDLDGEIIAYFNTPKGKAGYFLFDLRGRPPIFSNNPMKPSWSKIIKRCVLQMEIGKGMPAEALQVSWGKPADIRRTVSSGGVREQWIYGTRTFVYLDDGVVTGWQD